MTPSDPVTRMADRSPVAAASLLLGDPLPFPVDAAERHAFQAAFNQLPAMLQPAARIDLADQRLVSVFVDRVQPFHRGGVVKRAKQIAFGRTEAIDEMGRVCTIATGIIVAPEWLSGAADHFQPR